MKDIRYVIQIEFAFKPRRAKEKGGKLASPSPDLPFELLSHDYDEGRRSMDTGGSMMFAVGARHPRAIA